MDGNDPAENAVSSFYQENDAAYLTFPQPVEWNGWFFETSRTVCSLHDPVRFMLHSLDDGVWRIVGSSSYFRGLGSVVFFHAFYNTSTKRGVIEHFHTFRGNLALDSLANSLGGLQYLAIGLTGLLRAEHLATAIYRIHSVARIVIGLHYAAACAAASQPIAAIIYMSTAIIHYGILSLVAHECWIACFGLLGAYLLTLAAALHPHAYYGPQSPARQLLIPGSCMLAASAAVELFRLRAASAALSLIARDRSAYDALWAGIADALAPERARLCRAVAHIREIAAIEGREARQTCRPKGMSSDGGGFRRSASAGLLGGPGRPVPRSARDIVRDLGTLYNEASSSHASHAHSLGPRETRILIHEDPEMPLVRVTRASMSQCGYGLNQHDWRKARSRTQPAVALPPAQSAAALPPVPIPRCEAKRPPARMAVLAWGSTRRARAAA